MSIMNLYYPCVTLSKEERNKDEDEKIEIVRKIKMNNILEQIIE